MKSIFLTLVSQLFVCISTDNVQKTPIIKLTNGKVSGTALTVNRRTVYFFEGIKYGKAERFALPTAVPAWTGVHNAAGWRDACIQPAIDKPVLGRFRQTTHMSEDCLYLNVWTPKLGHKNTKENITNLENDLLPVMVWIYGGTFERGNIFTDLLDGKQFAEQGDVVFVTFNHRVGPFGFAYFGDDQSSNFGLHDQVLALKWVQKNIAVFGGNAKKVTLFGESTGSVSVGALILSPLASGLFHRAIMQSGAPTSLTRVSTRSKALKITRTLALQLNCPIKNSNLMLDCLKNRSTSEILSISKNAVSQNRLFLPIHSDKLLPLKPSKALQTGAFNANISLLFGVNRNEGSPSVDRWLPKLDELNVTSAKEVIKTILNFLNVSDDGDRITDHYISTINNQSSVEEQLKVAIAAVFGDYNFVYPTILFAEHYKAKSSSNFYSYRLMQPITFPPFCSGGHFPGVCHAIDLLYLFAIPNSLPADFQYSESEIQLSKDMLADWLSFAKEGKVVNPNWKPAFEKSKSGDKVERTMALELFAGQYQMASHFYESTCTDLWEEKLFSEE